MTDASQALVWDAQFDPFGEEVLIAGAATHPTRFPGQYADPETGFSYNYFRDYDPTIGRYVQSDPIGLDGGINTFEFVISNPVRYIDPNGTNINSHVSSQQFPIVFSAINGDGGGSIPIAGSNSMPQCPATCAQTRPNFVPCFLLFDYIYRSKYQAELSFGKPVAVRPPEGEPAEKGPCAADLYPDSDGRHFSVYHAYDNEHLGSITSCKCCEDTPKGPLIKELYRAH
jgi:RHS repeat-associated protein